VIDHNSSGCGNSESKHDTEHPERMHKDNDRVICVVEKDEVINVQYGIEQLAAK